MGKIVIFVFLTLVLLMTLASAAPLSKRQIFRFKSNRNALNKIRIEKDHRRINNNINNNNILSWKRLEAKKARLELIDEMLKFYWDTLEVFVFSFRHLL